ncbi:MAG TPA: hypothetical protein VF814_14500 [Casimicrobiaceae bacterium]
MSHARVIRFLDPVRGANPCPKSRGSWRPVVGDLFVCRACDAPAITCYAKLADYGELPPLSARALAAHDRPDRSHLPAQPAALLGAAPAV